MLLVSAVFSMFLVLNDASPKLKTCNISFSGKDRDLRKWAVEGLSFLTLDASVKEKLCEDEPAVRALVELAKSGRQVNCHLRF